MAKLSFYFALLLLASCNTKKGENAETRDKEAISTTTGTSYKLDSTSRVHWAASKPTATHEGTFNVTEGNFIVKDNALSSGHFTIDITSLKNSDLSPKDGKEKLEGHLKSPDFFDVAKFPTAKFEITQVRPNSDSAATVTGNVIISGNLTLRDSTKNITFPARVTIDASTLTAKADVNIDRTLWGMNYKGPGNPQDWVISKQVNLKLDVTGIKQ